MKSIWCSVLALLIIQMLNAAVVDSFDVFSQAMNKTVKCVVILPDTYKKRKSMERYPVVFMLHGYSGNQMQWLRDAPNITQEADERNVILICPDGGFSSWYFDSPVDSTVRYETFVTRELVSFIDQRFRTIPRPDNRAITGLSMGGHGALYLAIRNSQTFGLAGSICGGVDIRPFPENWNLKKVLGDTSCCNENWEKNTVINLVDSLKNDQLKLIIDCGLDDFFMPVNRQLHAKLVEKKITHEYIERSGSHNKEYWSNSIKYQLFYFSENWASK